jgi:hypothetical protein
VCETQAFAVCTGQLRPYQQGKEKRMKTTWSLGFIAGIGAGLFFGIWIGVFLTATFVKVWI